MTQVSHTRPFKHLEGVKHKVDSFSKTCTRGVAGTACIVLLPILLPAYAHSPAEDRATHQASSLKLRTNTCRKYRSFACEFLTEHASLASLLQPFLLAPPSTPKRLRTRTDSCSQTLGKQRTTQKSDANTTSSSTRYIPSCRGLCH
jgi:hypothetical protein